MPRPCKCRWITAEPGVDAFKPCGIPGRELEAVVLGLDELEAIRLADGEGLYQDAAAERMGVSRATFGRLVESARRKVADALLGPKMLIFQGGIIMKSGERTFVCAECGASFQAAHGAERPAECPTCHSTNFHRAEAERGGGREIRAGRCGGRGAGRGADGGAGRGRCRRRCRARRKAAHAAPTTAIKENAE